VPLPETPFNIKAEILADLWMNHREADIFLDFVEYNDLGLPVAYLVANGVVERNKIINEFVEETFSLLLSILNVEDTGFNSLSDLISPDIYD
jgi:hypothetical protein